MNKLDFKMKLLLGVFLLAAIIIPGRFGLGSFNLINAEADRVQQEAVNYNTQADSIIAEVVDNQEAFTAREEAAMNAIPQNPQVSGLIDEMASKASESGLIWLSGSPSTPVLADSGMMEYNLLISVKVPGEPGEFSSLTTVDAVSNFVDSVRTLNRLVVIDTLSVNPEDGTANITARFFSQTDGTL